MMYRLNKNERIFDVCHEITPKDTGLPLVVVSDGKMVPRSLELLHLSPADIERRLKNQSIAVEDVFLMTLDDCGNTFLQKKEGRA